MNFTECLGGQVAKGEGRGCLLKMSKETNLGVAHTILKQTHKSYNDLSGIKTVPSSTFLGVLKLSTKQKGRKEILRSVQTMEFSPRRVKHVAASFTW